MGWFVLGFLLGIVITCIVWRWPRHKHTWHMLSVSHDKYWRSNTDFYQSPCTNVREVCMDLSCGKTRIRRIDNLWTLEELNGDLLLHG